MRSRWWSIVVLLVGGLARAEAPDPYEKQISPGEPLSAAEQLKKFHLPPGFEIQLVAAEPDIRKPINLNFDDAGRLYATQSEEYPFEAPAGTTPRDVVKRFEQLADDGRAQKVTTVVSGLNIPIGVAPYGRDLIVHSIPDVYRCRDLDGDGVYEERKTLYSGFGHRDTHGMVNNITPWIDGWIYCCHGFSNTSEVQGRDGHKISMQSGNTFRIRPDGSRIEYVTHGQVNPFGLAFDPLGNMYTSDCHTLPAYQLLRGAWYPSFGKPHDGLGFGPTMIAHSHGSTGIAGIVYYASDLFPQEYRDTLFIGNPVTGRINHDRLKKQGSTLIAVEQPDFVRCDDPWFRPVDLKLGPDGAIYVADFYNRVIGHYEVPLTHPKRDRERGRIWRIIYRGPDGKSPPPLPDLARATPEELVERLADPRLAVRTTATIRLVREGLAPPLASPLRKLLVESSSDVARPHALWVVEQGVPGGLDQQLVERLADDSAAVVRVHVLKALAERPHGEDFSTLYGELLRKKLTDPDAFVRRAAADALGRHPEPRNVQPLLAAWSAVEKEDTHLLHVIRMAVRDHLLQDGYYRAATEAVSGMPDDELHVAEASLGVPRAEASAFLLAYLARRSGGSVPDGAYVEHVVRYANERDLPAAFEFARQFADRPREQQLVVLRAVHRGLLSRGAAVPANIAIWESQLAAGLLSGETEPQVQAGLEWARELRRAELHGDLLRIAGPGSRFPGLRTAAIDACVANDAARSIPLLSQILASAAEPIALRQKAAQALGNANSEAARAELLAQLKIAPERVGIEIAGSLASNKEGAERLLTAVAEGKASARLLQELTVDRRLRAAKVEDLDARLKKLTAGLPAADARLVKLVQTRREGFAKFQSDAALGQAVFKKNCAACHRIGSEGNKLGPELDGIGLRGLDRILEDVLDPNRNVDQAFRATQIVTTDGRVLLGLALRREGQVQVLADAQGKEVRVSLADIDEQVVSLLSPMPANVADILSEPDFFHLVAYLLSQRQGKT